MGKYLQLNEFRGLALTILSIFWGYIFIVYPSNAQTSRRPSTTQNPVKPKQTVIEFSKPENEFSKIVLSLYNTYISNASREVGRNSSFTPQIKIDSVGCNDNKIANAEPRAVTSVSASIEYCPAMMRNLVTVSKGDSLPINFIFAHELSHHILQHTFSACRTDKGSDTTQYNPCQNYEFAADALALWLICLREQNSHRAFPTLGSIRNMLTLIAKVNPDIIKGDVRHPSLAARLIGLTREFQEVNSSQKKLYRLDDVISKCKTFQTKPIEIELKRILNSEIDSLIDSPLTMLRRFWESTRRNNSLLTAKDTLNRVRIKLEKAQFKLDSITKYKLDETSTNEKVAKLKDQYKDISTFLEKVQDRDFTGEAIVGTSVVDGVLLKYNRPLDKQLYPVYTAGVRLSRQNWQNPFFCILSLDLTGNYGQLDIHQFIEDQIKIVERISRLYFQSTPRIGAGYHLRGYSGDGVENKVRTDFLSLSVGIPFRWGNYRYENFLTGQQGDDMHISSNNIAFSNYSKRQGNWYQKIVSTNLFDFSNFVFQLNYHHANRIGNGKRWNKIKKYSSYSISVAYQRPVLKIKQGEEVIINRFNVYEITLGYRWWR